MEEMWWEAAGSYSAAAFGFLTLNAASDFWENRCEKPLVWDGFRFFRTKAENWTKAESWSYPKRILNLVTCLESCSQFTSARPTQITTPAQRREETRPFPLSDRHFVVPLNTPSPPRRLLVRFRNQTRIAHSNHHQSIHVLGNPPARIHAVVLLHLPRLHRRRSQRPRRRQQLKVRFLLHVPVSRSLPFWRFPRFVFWSRGSLGPVISSWILSSSCLLCCFGARVDKKSTLFQAEAAVWCSVSWGRDC